MTKLLEKALDAVRRLPDSAQDEIARAMLTLNYTRGEAALIGLGTGLVEPIGGLMSGLNLPGL